MPDFAPGISEKGQRGNPTRVLTPGQRVSYVLQHHKTMRNPTRPHFDLRLGTPELGMYSWAVPRAELPAPGQKRLAPQTEVHDFGYNDFQGRIGKGYGAGEVTTADKGHALITKVSPNAVHFTLAHTKVPMRYSLVKINTPAKRDWLLVGHPAGRPEDVPGAGNKLQMQKIEAADMDEAIGKAAQETIMTMTPFAKTAMACWQKQGQIGAVIAKLLAATGRAASTPVGQQVVQRGAAGTAGWMLEPKIEQLASGGEKPPNSNLSRAMTALMAATVGPRAFKNPTVMKTMGTGAAVMMPGGIRGTATRMFGSPEAGAHMTRQIASLAGQYSDDSAGATKAIGNAAQEGVHKGLSKWWNTEGRQDVMPALKNMGAELGVGTAGMLLGYGAGAALGNVLTPPSPKNLDVKDPASVDKYYAKRQKYQNIQSAIRYLIATAGGVGAVAAMRHYKKADMGFGGAPASTGAATVPAAGLPKKHPLLRGQDAVVGKKHIISVDSALPSTAKQGSMIKEVPLQVVSVDGAPKGQLQVETTETEEERKKGLSKRASLPQNGGMLFDIPGPFWMKDCLIPLDIVFMSKSGEVLDCQTMKPMWAPDYMQPRYSSRKEGAAYAVEVPAGWCKEHTVVPGDRVIVGAP